MSAHVHETAWYSYMSSTQTMRSWARIIESYEDVPEQFRLDFPDYSGEFPYTVLVPEDKLSLWGKRNGRMLILLDERLVMLETVKKRIYSVTCPFREILRLEYGKILLHSWLTLETPDNSLHVTFNSTNSQCFEPIIERIRQGEHDAVETDDIQKQNGVYQKQLAAFLPLMRANYKYMNYGQQSIRSGDSVLKIVYQPERCLRTVRFLKKVLFRQYASNHLSILTERELILIGESRRRKSSKKNLYGAVFRYIPLQHISSISLVPATDNTHKTLEVILLGGLRQTLDFASDNKEIDDFYQALQNILGEERWEDFRVSPL